MTDTLHDSSLDSSSCPTIVLRKGKVELQIKNAAAIIKKIDELHPNTDSYSWSRNWNKINRELSDAEKSKQRKWMDAAQEWFRKEFFGGENNNFEVIVRDRDPEPTVTYNEDKHTVKTPMGEFTPECIEDLSAASRRVVPQVDQPKATNKNAYEIRLEVLKEALAFKQWQIDVKRDIHKDNCIPLDGSNVDITSESAMELAQKFYKFVENKR